MIRLQHAQFLLAMLCLSSVVTPAEAQYGGGSNNLEGFTVAGKGALAIKPNRLEIDLEISAASDISADVIVKYRDAKKRLQEAFTTLKMNNVVVEEKALTVDQKGQSYNPYMMDMPAARRGKVEVQLARKLMVKCDKIRDLDEEALLQLVSKLLDVAQDAGAKVGGGNDNNNYYYYRYGNSSNGLVRFILDDFDVLEEKAYQAAISDARRRAERLAKLSGVELGPVAGVVEVVIPGEGTQTQRNYYYGMEQSDDEMPKKQLTASKFHEIPVKVELMVRFTTATPNKVAKREGEE